MDVKQQKLLHRLVLSFCPSDAKQNREREGTRGWHTGTRCVAGYALTVDARHPLLSGDTLMDGPLGDTSMHQDSH